MKKYFFMAVIAICSSSGLLAQKIDFYTPGIVRVTRDTFLATYYAIYFVTQNIEVAYKSFLCFSTTDEEQIAIIAMIYH